MDTIKTCTTCRQNKPIAAFYKNHRLKDGRSSACKQCCDARTKKSRKYHPSNYNEKRIQHARDTRRRFHEWKEAKGCWCCGETFSPCLELHHLDPSKKDFTLTKKVTGNWDKFLEEARKCILVCANCHRKLHHGGLEVDVAKQYIFD